MMLEFTFFREPSGKTYQALICYATRWCNSITMVTRHSVPLSPRGQHVLEVLSPFLLVVTETNHWPGTELIDNTASLHKFTFGDEQASILLQATLGLYSWLQPELPEDLCLYRPDSSTWLATISHERDAFLHLTSAEVEDIKLTIPGLYDFMSRDAIL
ncbi:MAG: hypothetical protein ACYC7E_17675 [Armatimonadota bacterium]